MSSYLDSIPQAVATIVSSCTSNLGTTRSTNDLQATEKWVINLTDQLTRTFVKSLREAVAEGEK